MANRFVKQIFKNVPNHYSSVQFSSVTQSCPNLCNPMDCSTPGLPVHHQLLEFTQTHVRWVSDTNQPSHPLLLPPSIFPSIRVFSNESVLRIRWPKYWSFCFNISPSNEYSRLISFGMNWLDLLAVQGTLKSLLQHHSSKASILCHSVREMQMKATINYHLIAAEGASLVTQTVWNLLAMWETQVQSLSREESCRREWLPTTVFLPGEIHGQRSLVGYSPWDRRVRHHWATNTIIAAEQLYQLAQLFC